MRVAGLSDIFKTEQEADEGPDKLVGLFRNRVELKKEFAALRNEKYQLQDRVKEHRGSIERVEQRLEHLEALLLDPEWVHNVVVFYQLRRLAAHCAARAERFSEELKTQREQRVQHKTRAHWDKTREREVASVHARIGKVRVHLQSLEEQLLDEQDRLKSMGSVSRMLRGKEKSATLAEAEILLAGVRSEEQALLQELDEIANREEPPHRGLDIAAKRAINFMILAFAQQLYLQYRSNDLAKLAKDASEKSVGAVNYGTKAECDALLDCLAKTTAKAKLLDTDTELLRKRAGLLADRAIFANVEDAVPVAVSVATVFDIKRNGDVEQTDANLLGENYFGITRILSR